MRLEHVLFGEHKTPYLFGVDCVDELVDAITDHAPDAASVVLVADRQVLPHADSVVDRLTGRVPVHQYIVDSCERNKRLFLVESLLEYAVRCGANRTSLMISMGGGLVANVAGLAAALLYRGVRLVHLPTTPVAAFDAVLSQKQAVSLTAGKNLCGTYHPPSLIACDLTWLTTIPRRAVLTGVAEMAKNALAVVPSREQDFVQAVAELEHRPTHAFTRLCALGIDAKLSLLARDPRERHGALIFEYGHTLGHALETATAGEMSHGEAIAWGMLVAAEVSASLGHLDRAGVAHHHRVIAPLRLPPARDAFASVDRESLRAALHADNKRGYLSTRSADIPMVLLAGPGVPLPGPAGRPLTPVPEPVLLSAVDTVAGWAADA